MAQYNRTVVQNQMHSRAEVYIEMMLPVRISAFGLCHLQEEEAVVMELVAVRLSSRAACMSASAAKLTRSHVNT